MRKFYFIFLLNFHVDIWRYQGVTVFSLGAWSKMSSISSGNHPNIHIYVPPSLSRSVRCIDSHLQIIPRIVCFHMNTFSLSRFPSFGVLCFCYFTTIVHHPLTPHTFCQPIRLGSTYAKSERFPSNCKWNWLFILSTTLLLFVCSLLHFRLDFHRKIVLNRIERPCSEEDMATMNNERRMEKINTHTQRNTFLRCYDKKVLSLNICVQFVVERNVRVPTVCLTVRPPVCPCVFCWINNNNNQRILLFVIIKWQKL